jgi:enoyl-CoA hydratase/carnithine racemase
MTMDDAQAMGLVTEVWGDADLKGRTFVDAVIEYAKTFTPPNKASLAVGRIKRAVQSGLEAGFGEGLAMERELQQLLFQSRDAKEGIVANLEKRAPKFEGK